MTNYQLPITVWLFDIDGVLIHPGGYRAALKATVNHFSRAMGLGDLAPDDDTIAVFEACGLTSEWDSSAVCAGMMLAEAALADPGLELDGDFWRSLERVRARGPAGLRPDYRAMARRVAAAMKPGDFPGPTALKLIADDLSARAHFDGRREGLVGALHYLLADTRDFPRSPGMVLLQHFTLGSEGYAETYGLLPMFETPSLLSGHDRPALSEAGRERVRALMADGLRAAVFTARPCLPPRDLTPQPRGFAPEAELAARLVGLEDLPLIGYGRLEWLGGETGRHPEEYLKPSPVHALAAMGVALTGREVDSLRAAHQLTEQDGVGEQWQSLVGQSLSIHVFEDSAGGIRAVQTAGERLRASGVNAEVHAWGIATHAEKEAALRRLGARVFGDVNEAIEAALPLTPSRRGSRQYSVYSPA